MATLPGVKTLIKDGFFSQADQRDTDNRRVLIVARASASDEGTNGFELSNPTNELYNPTFYRQESEVARDFGVGSDAHIAFVQARKAGARNIAVVATAPEPVAPADPDVLPAGLEIEEYELQRALQFAEVVSPEVIAVFGYYANEPVGASNRVAKHATILAQKCAELFEESYPCQGVIAPVGIHKHLGLEAGSVIPVAKVDEYVNFLASDGTEINAEGTAFPLKVVVDNAEAAGTETSSSLSALLVIPVGEAVVVDQPAKETVDFTGIAAIVGGQMMAVEFDGALTKHRVPNIRGLLYTFSNKQLLTLIEARLMPINVDRFGLVVIEDGVTAALPSSVGQNHFTRLRTMTIVQEITRITRRVAETYIGKAANSDNLNALSTQLRSEYITLKQRGTVQQITFDMEYIPEEFKLNVNITVRPVGELREIVLHVGVTL